MNKLRELLEKKKLLVCDGAWGTMLQQKGLALGECPENWNLLYPERIKEIPLAYMGAGADLVKTNSFGGNRFRLEHYSLEDKIGEINKTAAALSKEAVGDQALVLGSMGPTGKLLLMDEVTPEDLYETFSIQARSLYEGGADALLIETFSDTEEAKQAVKAAIDNTPLEVIATFTFERTADNQFKTMMGLTPSDVSAAMAETGIGYTGTNCGNGFEDMVRIVNELKKCNPDRYIVVNANAGMPIIIEKRISYPESPEFAGSIVPALVEAGASIIGGCCGTTPQHISEIRRIIDKLLKKY
ncbi:MAG: homocysteine S-methyltransferase family protein [Ignavibacteriaceae bacterium]